MLATSGLAVPRREACSLPMIRADPGDFYDASAGRISMKNDRIQTEYIMWGRKEVFVQSAPDSSLSQPQILRPRIADQIGPY